jgi:hypothetical protein
MNNENKMALVYTAVSDVNETNAFMFAQINTFWSILARKVIF